MFVGFSEHRDLKNMKYSHASLFPQIYTDGMDVMAGRRRIALFSHLKFEVLERLD